MGKYRFITAFVLIFAVSVSVYAEKASYKWKTIKNDEGIHVYVSETPGSVFKTYKAEGVIDKPWEVLFEVLLDVPGYPEWMPGCTNSSIVKMIHEDPIEGDFIIHLVWDAIWPATNRDLVVEVQTDTLWDKDRVFVALKMTDKYNVPVPKGHMRLKDFYSTFDFKYIDKNHTGVTFTTMVDPGGVVPSRVADLQTASVPFDTLKGLAKSANNPKYYAQARKDYY